MTWTNKRGKQKKEVKLVVQFNKTDNKLTMKFVSPFAKAKNVDLEGFKETTTNGARFVGTAKVNNKPSKIEVEYSLKRDSPRKEFEFTWKGTQGSKFINVAVNGMADSEPENKVKGSVVVTSSEFKEASMKFEGEYGKYIFLFKTKR